MPRYVIEMDEPKTCCDCPMIWEDRTEGLEPSECQLADEWLPPGYSDNKPPEWCPLRRLEDSSLEKHADATLISIQRLINDSGPFPVEWDFETIRCHGCGETFVALVAGRSRHCPRCGAELNIRRASEVKFSSYVLVSVDNERRAQELRELRKKLGV